MVRAALRHWTTKRESKAATDPETLAALQFWQIDIKVMVVARYGLAALSETELEAKYDLSRALLPYGFHRFHDRLLALSGANVEGLGACVCVHDWVVVECECVVTKMGYVWV